MSSSKPVKKKIVVTGAQEKNPVQKNEPKTNPSKEEKTVEMLFQRKNYYLIFGGLALIAIGLLLMSGGKMPSPDVWDESLIYSPRRIILAPIVILSGLGLVLISIFRK